jgi:hypothetical protein
MSDLPLDETALAAAALDAPFVGRSVVERIVSTYLRKARFEVVTLCGRTYVKTPWVSVVQAESEEE